MTDPQLPEDVQELVNRLFNYARTGGTESAELLAQYIDHGVDVNMKNQDGNSLLMLAAYSGNVEIVDALIARGAKVDELNERHQSPLAGAIFKKEDEVIDRLIAAGANPLLGLPTALDTAKMFGREDLVKKFEESSL